MTKNTIKIDLLYSGNVQGIGFRYTAKQIADELKLTGFTKNLPDGRVEVIVQGEEKDITDFENRLQHELKDNIETVEENIENSIGLCKDFNII